MTRIITVKHGNLIILLLISTMIFMACRRGTTDTSDQFRTDQYGDASYLYEKRITEYSVENSKSLKTITIPEGLHLRPDNVFGQLMDVIDTLWYVPLETKAGSLLSAINRVVVYNGNIYIYDIGTRRLLIFDAKGRFKTEVGNHGRGPGEHLLLTWFEIINNELVVSDGRGNKLLYYSLEGEFLREMKMPLRYSSFFAIDKDLIVVDIDGRANFHLEKVVDSKLVFFNNNWNIIGKGMKYDALGEVRNSLLLRHVIFRGSNGNVYYSPNFDYFIYRIDADGGQLVKEYFINAGKNRLPDGFRNDLSIDKLNKELGPSSIYMTNIYEANNQMAIHLQIKGIPRTLYYSIGSGVIRPSHALGYSYEADIHRLNDPMGSYSDFFISSFSAEELADIAKEEVSASGESRFSERFLKLCHGVDPEDNPVLVFYRLKPF